MVRTVVAIVGYKNSGKTTLARALARELGERGLAVAVVKHTRHAYPLDTAGKDTALLGEVAGAVALVTPQESALFWRRPLGLDEVITHLEADVVLVEGSGQAAEIMRPVGEKGEGHGKGPQERGLSLCQGTKSGDWEVFYSVGMMEFFFANTFPCLRIAV